MFSNPKTLAIALLAGIIPSLLWLWFWLREDKKKPEPKGLLAMIFVVGMASVFFVLPIESFIQNHVFNDQWRIIGWASIEELFKYFAVVIVVYRTSCIEEPIDWPILLITSAVGFAALENALFLLKPISLNQTTVGLLTGQLRYLGSTLLHTVASGTIGISLGLAFTMDPWKRKFYLFFGLIFAIALHSAFNFFIMRNGGNDFLKVFGFLWVVTIIIMLLFEKLRRMSGEDQ